MRQRREQLGAGWDAEDHQPDDTLPTSITVTGPLGRMPLAAATTHVRAQLAQQSSLLTAKQDQALRNLLQGLVAREVVLTGEPLRFTPGPLLWLTHVGRRALFGLGDRLLDLPDRALPFLGALLATADGFAKTDVRGLDDDSRAVPSAEMLYRKFRRNLG